MKEEKKEGFVIRDKRFQTLDRAAAPEAEPEVPRIEAEPEAPQSQAPPAAVAVEVEKLRSALADLEEAKHRVRRDAERQLDILRSDLLAGVIPFLDNLERCVAAAETSRNVDALLEGVKLVQSQLLRTLVDLGLERVGALGERFDPRVHDAVAVVPVEDASQDGVVVAELEPAYRFGDRIVRPARVQVGRAADRPAS